MQLVLSLAMILSISSLRSAISTAHGSSATRNCLQTVAEALLSFLESVILSTGLYDVDELVDGKAE